MPYFNILSITVDGDIADPMVMGQHSTTFDVSKVGMEKHGDDAHYFAELDYEHHANGQFLFRIKVATKWLIVKPKQDELEKAKQFVRHLLIRSISHFNGVLDTKMKERGWMMRLPDDPDLRRAIELTNDLVENYFKQ